MVERKPLLLQWVEGSLIKFIGLLFLKGQKKIDVITNSILSIRRERT